MHATTEIKKKMVEQKAHATATKSGPKIRIGEAKMRRKNTTQTQTWTGYWTLINSKTPAKEPFSLLSSDSAFYLFHTSWPNTWCDQRNFSVSHIRAVSLCVLITRDAFMRERRNSQPGNIERKKFIVFAGREIQMNWNVRESRSPSCRFRPHPSFALRTKDEIPVNGHNNHNMIWELTNFSIIVLPFRLLI